MASLLRPLLRGLADADGNGDGFIEVSELASFISKTFASLQSKQELSSANSANKDYR
jgi:hypothetical protein